MATQDTLVTPKTITRTLTPISNRQGAFVTIDGNQYIDFSSNDYLGFSEHPNIKFRLIDAAQYGVGSTGSRLLSGDYDIFHKLETELACLKGKEAALVFNSGYQMNNGLIPTLFGKEDLIIADKYSHASIVDGCRASQSKFLRFKHNDIYHLDYLLDRYRKQYRHACIITESLFSMDGDMAPIEDLIKLKEHHHCQLYIDEAHAIGVYGQVGEGLISKETASKIDYIVGTFGKALGGFGAFLSCDNFIKDQLINACRAFIYSTALPAPIVASNLCSIELLQNTRDRREKVHSLAQQFRLHLKDFSEKLLGNSHIIPILIGDEDPALSISELLKEAGFWAPPIRTPTVPEGKARLRFSITAHHTESMIENVCNIIKTEL